jgi:hypothetical protein
MIAFAQTGLARDAKLTEIASSCIHAQATTSSAEAPRVVAPALGRRPTEAAVLVMAAEEAIERKPRLIAAVGYRLDPVAASSGLLARGSMRSVSALSGSLVVRREMLFAE